LVEPSTRGDPVKPLLWTSRSLRSLARELTRQGFRISPRVVGEYLRRLGYSLQANSKTKEGGQHIDRDAQFHYINDQATGFLAAREPVVSVDTKKKELVGNFKNNGREWRAQGQPEHVNVHDFIDPKLARAVPYGVFDITNNVGWVSVGTDHDTASFAVHAIRRWWKTMVKETPSPCDTAYDLSRWRRQQRLSRAPLEDRVAETGQRVQGLAAVKPDHKCQHSDQRKPDWKGHQDRNNVDDALQYQIVLIRCSCPAS
jgi:DDE family transposase